MKSGQRKMKLTWAERLIRREEGLVLIAALMFMTILTLLGTTAYVMTSTETKVGGNYRTSQEVLYAANAGIEDGRNFLLANWGSQDLSTELQARASGDGNLGTADDIVVVSRALGNTVYNVFLTNDAADGTTNTNDTNQRGLLTSTAAEPNGSTATVQAIVSLAWQAMPNPPGAASIVGETHSVFGGNAFLIDGRNYDMNGNLDNSSPDKLGISVGDIVAPSSQTPQEAIDEVNDSLTNQQRDNVQGSGEADPSTGIDDSLTHDAILNFVNFLASRNDNYLTLREGGDIEGPIEANTDSDGDITIGEQTINLGTVENPMVTFIDGVAGGDIQADFSGTISGAGILVVRNNDLILRGKVDWKGLIIVSGDDVGFGLFGGGGPQVGVLGGVIVDERDTDNGNELVVQGNGTIRYSQAALDMLTSKLLSSVTVVAWRQVNN